MPTTLIDRQVGDIVADDFRTAAVFQKHGIDFCCGGRQSVADACTAKGVSTETLAAELEEIAGTYAPSGPHYAEWPVGRLVDHILDTHHVYIRRAIPAISAYARKVADVHGPRHPEVVRIAEIFAAVAAELEQHMFKEERILFPAIVQLGETGHAGSPGFGSIANPIRMMEHEHDSAGAGFDSIRALSNGYTLPADACTTFTVLYKELAAFEDDLHTHIHLENNILFPKALDLERGIG